MGGTLQPERGVSGPRASIRSARGVGGGLLEALWLCPRPACRVGAAGYRCRRGPSTTRTWSASSSCSVATWEVRRSGRRRCSVRCGWSRCGTRCAGRRSARAAAVGAAAPRREAYRGRKGVRDSVPARERAGRQPSPSRTLPALPVPCGASRREKRPSSPALRSRCAYGPALVEPKDGGGRRIGGLPGTGRGSCGEGARRPLRSSRTLEGR